MSDKKKLIQKLKKKEIKSDNFCYRKVGRAISKWGVIKKSPIWLSEYWKNDDFQNTKNYFAF